MIAAIDPGPSDSAVVVYSPGCLGYRALLPNHVLLQELRDPVSLWGADELVIEWIRSYGMAVGDEIFDTCRWIGRFQEAWTFRGLDVHLLPRVEVKKVVCMDGRAKDANIRAALIDRFGGSRQAAMGTKKRPGPLYGVHADIWAALAVAVAWAELHP